VTSNKPTPEVLQYRNQKKIEKRIQKNLYER